MEEYMKKSKVFKIIILFVAIFIIFLGVYRYRKTHIATEILSHLNITEITAWSYNNPLLTFDSEFDVPLSKKHELIRYLNTIIGREVKGRDRTGGITFSYEFKCDDETRIYVQIQDDMYVRVKSYFKDDKKGVLKIYGIKNYNENDVARLFHSYAVKKGDN